MNSVLQFGGGRFLRGFIDRFFSDAGVEHAVTVVTSTPSPRADLVNTHGSDGYPIFVRGIENGQTVDQIEQSKSLKQGIVAGGHCDRTACYAKSAGLDDCVEGQCYAEEQWAKIQSIAASGDLSLIVSNTTEAGLVLDAGDAEFHYSSAPISYPAKLASLLFHRWRSLKQGVTILPCELIEKNGEKLLALVLEQAAAWQRPEAFQTWLKEECRWINNLVDCIVIGPSDDSLAGADHPLAVQVEPYALLAVEGDVPDIAPFSHSAVVKTNDLTPFYLRKVRILNGLHTAMVAKYLDTHTTVRDVLADADAAAWLKDLLDNEIVPTIADRVADVDEFAAAVMDRFANPFLEHKLADISLNHEAKLDTRLRPTLDEFRERFGKEPEKLASLFNLKSFGE